MLTKPQLADSRLFLIFVAGLAALGPLSIDMYLPTLPELANSFGAGIAAANLTVSTFMVGMAIGQFFGGPLSDQLGRKIVGLIGLMIYISATLLIISAKSIEEVQLFRVFQAVGGGFCSVICMAQARDIFAPNLVTRKFANIILVVLLAPMIAPLIGATLAHLGWRVIFWVLIFYAGVMTIIYLWRFPETNDTRSDKFNLRDMLGGYGAAIMNRTEGRLISLRYAIFGGFSSGILFSFVTNASFIFIEYFEVSTFEFAGIFALIVLMMMMGNRLSAYSLGAFSAPKILFWANTLQIVTAAAVVLACAFWEPGIWTILIGFGLLIACSGAISPVASGHFIGLFSKNIGSASSLNASIMFLFGALIGGLGAILSNGALLPIFAVILGSAVIGRIVLRSAVN